MESQNKYWSIRRLVSFNQFTVYTSEPRDDQISSVEMWCRDWRVAEFEIIHRENCENGGRAQLRMMPRVFLRWGSHVWHITHVIEVNYSFMLFVFPMTRSASNAGRLERKYRNQLMLLKQLGLWFINCRKPSIRIPSCTHIIERSLTVQFVCSNLLVPASFTCGILK